MLPAGGSVMPSPLVTVPIETPPPVTWLMNPMTRDATRLVPPMVSRRRTAMTAAGAEPEDGNREAAPAPDLRDREATDAAIRGLDPVDRGTAQEEGDGAQDDAADAEAAEAGQADAGQDDAPDGHLVGRR